MDGTALRVVIIDDDPQQLEMYSRWLRLSDVDVLPVLSDVDDVTGTVAAFRPHVILVDLILPRVPGSALIRLMRRRIPSAYYIVFSAACAEKLRKAQGESGADAALLKSTPPEMFVRMVKSYEDAQAKGNG